METERTHWDGCWKISAHHACAVAEIARLQAVVDKLPKDAEGVYCVPGDPRWAWTHPGGGQVAILFGTVLWIPGGEWRIGFGTRAHPVAVDAGYGTRQAAEAKETADGNSE